MFEFLDSQPDVMAVSAFGARSMKAKKVKAKDQEREQASRAQSRALCPVLSRLISVHPTRCSSNQIVPVGRSHARTVSFGHKHLFNQKYSTWGVFLSVSNNLL